MVLSMYATQKNQLRKLNGREFLALTALCRLSKNLFNVALYECRQYFFSSRKRLTYESNYHICKENENYKLLNTDIAQQTMKVVDRSMRSFVGLVKAISIGRCDQKPQLPKYLPKEGYFPLIIPRIKVSDGMFKIPMSPEFKKAYGEVKIQLPERLKDKQIKEVRIHPVYSARWFEIEYVYEDEKIESGVKPDSSMAIDLGVDNLAACFDTEGHQFLIDGKKLKSINQWYNKRNAQLQSAKDKQGIKGLTNQQAFLNGRRNNSVRDYLNKAARIIINHCLTHKIGKLIVGYNPGIKQEINIGRINNQNIVSIPFWQLRRKLESLCERYSIHYVEQEESYTSKASFYDGDEIPVYNADNPGKYKFSGKRIKRGLYRTKDKHSVSADINGAANILVKSKHGLDIERVSSGFLANPLRMKIS
ncbi:MAG: IS200/IS605 family transposase ISAsp8 [Chroococcopsis gigantea SAG 12.99]|jgi:putative transposase|nr:IS200/IS605 family transposase ISAsp8 [Chroococcopsis gigantea SAG 12.99]